MREMHLSDNRLTECCLTGRLAAPDERHLAQCARCRERHMAVTQMLADVSLAANVEADKHFTDDRLAKQRARILHRIDQDSRGGRVLAFPAGGAPTASLRTRPAMRWLVGAAVAGLVIGLLAGHLPYDFRGAVETPPQNAIGLDAETLQAVSTTLSDDELLGLIDRVIDGTSGSTLQPLDDLTPQVAEAATQ
jgi:hypothetical protein